MSDSFLVPATTLPALALWVTESLGLANPEMMHMTNHQQGASIKIQISNGGSYREALDKGCNSLGVIPRFNEIGELQLVGMDYLRDADFEITYDDIREISIGLELPELTSLMLNHSYDYDENQYAGKLMANNVSHNYPDGWFEPEEVDTVLVSNEAATDEIHRRASRKFVRRRMYNIVCFIRGAAFSTGDRLKVFHPLWGLDDTGTIWDVEKMPGSNKFTLEVEI